ncbi:ATPase, P-loop-containing, partial [mine drainage metagenome]
RRYSETRRRHPLSTDQLSLREAIRRERDLLAPLSEEADLTIDTSRKTVHELRSEIRARLNHHQRGRLVILFESFAFRDGVPLDADLVFDARCLPNPHWEPGLRNLTGRDPAVIRYLEGFNQVRELVRDIEQLVTKWLPAFEAQNRSYLTVAIGCTGGRHRSVYVSETLAKRMSASQNPALVRHLKLEPEAHPPRPDFAPGPSV